MGGGRGGGEVNFTCLEKFNLDSLPHMHINSMVEFASSSHKIR